MGNKIYGYMYDCNITEREMDIQNIVIRFCISIT